MGSFSRCFYHYVNMFIKVCFRREKRLKNLFKYQFESEIQFQSCLRTVETYLVVEHDIESDLDVRHEEALPLRLFNDHGVPLPPRLARARSQDDGEREQEEGAALHGRERSEHVCL